jgi:proteic killer suppression protein
MIEISFDDSFKRACKKRFQGNHELERKFRIKLEKFKENPFDPSLKTHKLSGKLKELWSFSIEYNQSLI